MSEARDAVDATEALIRSLIPTASQNLLGPAELQVVSFKYGKGVATYGGTVVDIQAHPLQTLNPGDVAVGVPVKLNKYYVVGKL